MTTYFHDPVSIGDGDEFGPYSSLSSSATHTLTTTTDIAAVSLTDSFFGGGGSTGAVIDINTNIDDGIFDTFASLSIHHNLADVPSSLYGIKITTATEGGSDGSQYGLFIGDQSSATNSYAIYTQAGSVRFGYLAGSGIRPLYVQPDGTLSV
jgi:hypothetical protein